MNDKCFVDTNILVYAHDQSCGAKHERARRLVEELWNSARGVLSTQVLQELCINVRRKTKRPLSLAEVRLLIQDLLNWEVVVNTAASVLEALDLDPATRFHFGTRSSSRRQKAQGPECFTPRIFLLVRGMVPFLSSTPSWRQILPRLQLVAASPDTSVVTPRISARTRCASGWTEGYER